MSIFTPPSKKQDRDADQCLRDRKTVELTDEEYERFSQNLTVHTKCWLVESSASRTDKHGIARCLLVMAENRQDGILALTEGSDRAMCTPHTCPTPETSQDGTVLGTLRVCRPHPQHRGRLRQESRGRTGRRRVSDAFLPSTMPRRMRRISTICSWRCSPSDRRLPTGGR